MKHYLEFSAKLLLELQKSVSQCHTNKLSDIHVMHRAITID